MGIDVTLDEQKHHYVVSSNGYQIAILPLVYLEGRKSAHIHRDDIEKAFSDVFDVPEGYASDYHRRDAALKSLGLIHA